MPISVSNWGIPYPKESAESDSVPRCGMGLGLQGCRNLSFADPDPRAEASLTAACLGRDMYFFWFFYTETVALQGSSFMKRSLLQLPSFSPRASYPVLV